jgi:ABC-2 type transport system permease protein
VRNVLAIACRELRAYTTGWMAYIVTAGFLLIGGFIFWVILYNTNQAEMRWGFQNWAVTFLFIAPLITMRLLAEEKKTGTLELLTTSPVTDAQVVLGKYLGAVGLLVGMLVMTFVMPLLLLHYNQPEFGPIWVGYLGLLLAGGSFLAAGLLASSVTDSQVVAGFLGFGILLSFWIIGWAAPPGGTGWASALQYLSIVTHLEDFSRGVIDTKDLVYYVSFIAVFLFFTVRVMESGKWK